MGGGGVNIYGVRWRHARVTSWRLNINENIKVPFLSYGGGCEYLSMLDHVVAYEL